MGVMGKEWQYRRHYALARSRHPLPFHQTRTISSSAMRIRPPQRVYNPPSPREFCSNGSKVSVCISDTGGNASLPLGVRRSRPQ